jgi:hypothetical protein
MTKENYVFIRSFSLPAFSGNASAFADGGAVSKKFHDLGGVKFSKDGQTVLIAEADTVYLYDAYTGEPTMYEKLAMPHTYRNKIGSVDITDDGKYIGAFILDTFRMWEYNTGKIHSTLFLQVRGQFKFINNSRTFITMRYSDNENKWGFIVYNYDDGSEVRSGTYVRSPYATAYSYDDRFLAFSDPV